MLAQTCDRALGSVRQDGDPETAKGSPESWSQLGLYSETLSLKEKSDEFA